MPTNLDLVPLQKCVSAGSSSVDIKLTLCQLYLMQGSVYSACEVLQDLGPLRYKPGVVSSFNCALSVTTMLSYPIYANRSPGVFLKEISEIVPNPG